MKRHFILAGFIGGTWLASALQADFWLAPYVQDVTTSTARIVWWTSEDTPGQIAWRVDDQPEQRAASTPQRESAFEQQPWRHEIQLTGLRPNTSCDYTVRQGDRTWSARFVTAPGPDDGFTFAVAADTETKADDPKRDENHRAVLKLIRTRQPRFLLYSGDLVDMGDTQGDWDAFWSGLVQTRPEDSVASHVPIYAALGNHDYAGYRGEVDGQRVPAYSQPYAERGVERFRAYFSFPPNDRPAGDPRQERYYSFTMGPACFIVLDTNNDSISTDDPATNWDTNRHRKHAMIGENEPPEPGGPGFAPDIHGGIPGQPDSPQYAWLERTLRDAAQHSAFIFVFFHQAPYSSFNHGDPRDDLPGHPLRRLDPLFHRYRVSAVICGHDEAYERSTTTSSVAPAGTDAGQSLAAQHTLQYYVLHCAADHTGLRQPMPDPVWQQGYSRYLYPLDRRRHGYLSVRIEPLPEDRFAATLTPMYYEPADPDNAELHYDDVVRIESARPVRSAAGSSGG